MPRICSVGVRKASALEAQSCARRGASGTVAPLGPHAHLDEGQLLDHQTAQPARRIWVGGQPRARGIPKPGVGQVHRVEVHDAPGGNGEGARLPDGQQHVVVAVHVVARAARSASLARRNPLPRCSIAALVWVSCSMASAQACALACGVGRAARADRARSCPATDGSRASSASMLPPSMAPAAASAKTRSHRASWSGAKPAKGLRPSSAARVRSVSCGCRGDRRVCRDQLQLRVAAGRSGVGGGSQRGRNCGTGRGAFGWGSAPVDGGQQHRRDLLGGAEHGPQRGGMVFDGDAPQQVRR